MTTIFPAPGTITSTNPYIVNWYLYDTSALQYPTLVKIRSDNFSTIDTLIETPNMESYPSDVYGDIIANVTSQTLEYSTTNTTTPVWYAFEKDILSYNINHATTITLYFNQTPLIVPFKTNSVVRVSSKVYGYSKIFTVLNGQSRSITIEFDIIPPSFLTIDNITESVYYQTRIPVELTTSNSRKNLHYSTISPSMSPSIKIPETLIIEPPHLGLNFYNISTQTAISIFKDIYDSRTADNLVKLKTDLNAINIISEPVTLSSHFSDLHGDFVFNILSQTPSYLTVNTSVTSWYAFENQILTYTTIAPTTTTIFFNNAHPFNPFPVNSTVRIKHTSTNFLGTFTVLKSSAISVTITYIEFEPVGAIIENTYETVYQQSSMHFETSVSPTRLNLNHSVIAPSVSPSITIPYIEKYNEIITDITSNILEKPISVITDVNASILANPISKAKLSADEILTSLISDKLETHVSVVSGEYSFFVKSRSVDIETYNTNVVNWYLFDVALTYQTRQSSSITMYFDTAYYQQFIPFKIGSTVRISNKLWFSESATVLNSSSNSITIDFIADLPFNLYIDNITETVYDQNYTFLTLSSASDSRKKLYSSVLYGATSTSYPIIDKIASSVNDNLIVSGNMDKQISKIADIETNISSSTISKQIANLSGDENTIKPLSIIKYRITDVSSSDIEISGLLNPYDSVVDGLFVYVNGSGFTYNVVNWYINESDILPKTLISNPTTTLTFTNPNEWKLFSAGKYVRITHPSFEFEKDVLVTSATLYSITFDTPLNFPSSYTGMTINHLYSSVYYQSLVDVVINPPNLTLPRENLSAASNNSFVSVYPIGKLVYNSRGNIYFLTLGNDLAPPPDISSYMELNSYDLIKSGLELNVLGQPTLYDVPSWYINDDTMLISSVVILGETTTIVFENTTIAKPFLENQYVRIEHLEVNFSQDVLVLSSSLTSITFTTIDNFPSNYSGMKISQLYSSVYPQSLVDYPTLNPFNLTLPRENLAALSNTGFVSLFPISKLIYNTRGTYAISPYVPSFADTIIENTANSLVPYDLVEDGMVVIVIGQPILYNVVSWYINDSDILLGSNISSPITTTLVFEATLPGKIFKPNYYVKISNGIFSQIILVNDSTPTSITFDTPNNFPSNYTGMSISRLYSPISKQSIVNDQISLLVKPTDLTTPQENLAASLNKPNLRGYQLIFGGIERFNDLPINVDARGRLEIFDDTRLPGDFDTTITSSSLVSTTTTTTTINWYTYDQEIISYNIITTEYATIQFNDYGFIPFKTGSTVKIIANNMTFFASVFEGTSSYITINHQGYTITVGSHIQQVVTSVYPQSHVVTTIAPVLPRENLYYMRLRSSTPLDTYFHQLPTNTNVSSLSKQIMSVKGDSSKNDQRGSISQYRISPLISSIIDNRKVELLSNITTLKPVEVNISMLLLKYQPIVVSDATIQQNGIVDKFLVNRISEIGRETIITIPSTRDLPIQFWN